MSAITEFSNGYKKALINHGIAVKNNLICKTGELSKGNIENGYETAKKLFAKKKDITAVITFNDMLAIGVLKALNELRIKIPEDVSVIGFGNDIELHSYYENEECPLSTVSAQREILGLKAVDLLKKRIVDKDKSNYYQVRIEPKLILRKTAI